MPKETFFNLKEEKREKIIAVALEEFKENDYSQASISRMVEKAGIAKGSFYQYFSGKKDLFGYIIDLAVEKKLDYLKTIQIGEKSKSFFDLLKEIYFAGLRFSLENPELGEISDNLMRTRDKKLREEILGKNMEKSDAFLTVLLERGSEDGEIKKGIDFEFTAFIITRISIAMGDYIRERDFEHDKMGKLVEKVIFLLENGLQARGD